MTERSWHRNRWLPLITALLLLFSLLPGGGQAHSGDATEAPYGSTPTIDGTVEQGEWNDSEVVSVTVEGDDVDIYFKHDREKLYIAFDIQQGHNSIFPDTRVFLDTFHDGAGAPQEDDFELYINPDNGGLRERQGNGNGWEQVDIDSWDGDWEEDGTDHWTTEYEVWPGKLGNLTGNETLGIAFLVYGNALGSDAVWPDNADIDDPSTWANITFRDWVNETEGDGGEGPPEPPPEPQGDNDTNGTGNGTGEDDDSPGFRATAAALGMGLVALVRRRWKQRESPSR